MVKCVNITGNSNTRKQKVRFAKNLAKKLFTGMRVSSDFGVLIIN
jgi:hypothetical protein